MLWRAKNSYKRSAMRRFGTRLQRSAQEMNPGVQSLQLSFLLCKVIGACVVSPRNENAVHECEPMRAVALHWSAYVLLPCKGPKDYRSIDCGLDIEMSVVNSRSPLPTHRCLGASSRWPEPFLRFLRMDVLHQFTPFNATNGPTCLVL